MIAAPTLEDVLSHRRDHPNALCCILLAPPFSTPAKENVIPRLGYLDHRSGKHVHFYCAGYGAYWRQSNYPDMKPIGEVTYDGEVGIPWSFSQKAFAAFVEELEKATCWEYKEETELIVLNPAVAFTDVLILDLDKMVEDKAIDRPSAVFTSLIRYAKRSATIPSAFAYSDTKAKGIFGKAVLNALLEGPKSLNKAWKAGRHFATRSIAK